VRNWDVNDSKTARGYITPLAAFAAQMKMLHDSGYQSILPGQLVAHLKGGAPLPSRPVLITFDDATATQYTNALPVLNDYGFKAVFFIMTVSVNKTNYLNTRQIAELSAQGHVIGAHTWDHKNVRQYTTPDREQQIVKPTKLLETITGKPVVYFAYPFGVWNKEEIESLKSNQFAAAFQLAGKGDSVDSLYTINRILVDGHWGMQQFIKALKK
jgi:peptidoglycan/xylan/chitin deacetylase (PgdA/CDA1 family)